MYIAKDFDSDNDEDEVVYIVVKDESNNEENEKMTLISHVCKIDTWIIDSVCSHHITSDKSKFDHLEHYDGRSARFGNDEPCYVKGKRLYCIN